MGWRVRGDDIRAERQLVPYRSGFCVLTWARAGSKAFSASEKPLLGYVGTYTGPPLNLLFWLGVALSMQNGPF